MLKMTSMRWMTLAIAVAVLTLILCAFLFRSQIWVAITCSGGTPQAELEGPVVQAWVATYDGPGGEWNGDNDHAVAIQTDSLGNVYVTGSSGTIKYDSAGNELWVVDSPANKYHAPNVMAVDAMYNVYVTGYSGAARYDSMGNLLWTNTHKGSALAVDAVGNVYVTGDSGTAKYDSAGNLLWTNTLKGSALAVDAVGNVYVTSDSGTVKYDSAGNLLWTDTHRGEALALDAFGNLHVTGSSGTAKYNIEGNMFWNDTTMGSDIAVDAFRNVYITVLYSTLHIPDKYTTVKFGKDGERLWTADLDGPVGGNDEARAVAVDLSGNIYVTGTIAARTCKFFLDMRTYTDYATVKYVNQVEQ
jgi:hypothetical protein